MPQRCREVVHREDKDNTFHTQNAELGDLHKVSTHARYNILENDQKILMRSTL